MSKLSVARVRALRAPGRYPDGETLYLHVTPTGSKSWVQRLVIHGRRHDIGLGGFPVTTLAEAREKARENRRLARAGGDPLTRKRRESAPVFEQATLRTLAAQRPRWRNDKHARSWLQTLQRHAFPVLASMRVDQIDRQDVLRVLEPIWGTKKETARRVRQRIRTVLSWCQAHGLVEHNVAGEMIDGALPSMNAEPEHLRSLPHSEMAKVLRAVETGSGAEATKLCFRFTVLTAARGNETRLARWDEIDLEARLWSLPALRTKTGKPWTQPLSAAAVDVLERARLLDDRSGLVFPAWRRGGKPLSNVAMTVLLRSNGLAERMTVHGCRASFRT